MLRNSKEERQVPFHEGWAGRLKQPWEETLQILAQPELKKTLILSALHFLMAVGLFFGAIAANALLIHRVGTAPLFYVYFFGSVLALSFVGLFFFLVSRFSHEKVFYVSFFLVGLLLLGLWVWLQSASPPAGLYIAVRAIFYAIFVFTSLQYWLIASDYFNNFEARRRFPILVAAGILGETVAGLLSQLAAVGFHAVNFILIWGLILLVFPPFFLKLLSPLKPRAVSLLESLPGHGEPCAAETDMSRFLLSGFPLLLFIFWVFYSFSSFSIDYVFNTEVLRNFSEEDEMAAYFGRIAMIASFAIFLYQAFFASRLTLKVGVDRTIFIIPALIAVTWGVIYFYPSLLTLSIAQIGIYYFADYAAVALLHPVLNVFPERRRGAVKVFTEGLGRPAGTFMLLLVALVASFQLNVERMTYVMIAFTLVFLAYPFVFQRAYLKYLLHCLQSKDPGLVSNAIQALGERNKKAAVSPLLSLLGETRQISLKRTIVLTLGQIQSREAFRVIVDLFSVRNESLQMAIVESLSSYKNYQSMFELFRLTKSKKNVSFQVRMSATILLTRLVGKKMIPFLLEALEDQDPRVRANAIESIGTIRDPKTIPILLPYLQDENHRVRTNAIIALSPFRKTRNEASKYLEDLYRSDQPMDRLGAIFAIGELRTRHYERDLVALLDSLDKKVLLHVTSALGKMKNHRFCEPFLKLLLDEEEAVALDAVRHMGKFPRYSRYLVFEKFTHLNASQRSVIFARLDKTALDFSNEKQLLHEEDVLAAPVQL